MSRFHALTVKDVRRETPDAVSIAFELPADAAEAYRFRPGQYLTLRRDFDGVEARRSYSICSGLDDGELRIAVKKVPGGLFSCFANDNLAPGMTLDVMTPDGRFTADPEPEAAHDYVAFAAGSGITPVLSIVRTILMREPKSRFTLFYGNRDRNAVIFREELEDLKDRYLERFTLIHLLSREAQDVALLHGRLDGERIKALAEKGLFDPKAVDAFFFCGPGDMIEQGRAALTALGVPEEKLRFELFTPAEGSAPRPPRSQAAETAAQEGVEIEAHLDGALHSFRLSAEDESVIDAAHRQGIELPYSCKGGMCCTCRAKVVEGAVEMAQNFSLEPWELEAGFVLTCQSRPLTKKLVLDYDEV